MSYREFLKGGGSYNHHQIYLAEKFFQVVKKDLHFESVSDFIQGGMAQ